MNRIQKFGSETNSTKVYEVGVLLRGWYGEVDTETFATTDSGAEVAHAAGFGRFSGGRGLRLNGSPGRLMASFLAVRPIRSLIPGRSLYVLGAGLAQELARV